MFVYLISLGIFEVFHRVMFYFHLHQKLYFNIYTCKGIFFRGSFLNFLIFFMFHLQLRQEKWELEETLEKAEHKIPGSLVLINLCFICSCARRSASWRRRWRRPRSARWINWCVRSISSRPRRPANRRPWSSCVVRRSNSRTHSSRSRSHSSTASGNAWTNSRPRNGQSCSGFPQTAKANKK